MRYHGPETSLGVYSVGWTYANSAGPPAAGGTADTAGHPPLSSGYGTLGPPRWPGPGARTRAAYVPRARRMESTRAYSTLQFAVDFPWKSPGAASGALSNSGWEVSFFRTSHPFPVRSTNSLTVSVRTLSTNETADTS